MVSFITGLFAGYAACTAVVCYIFRDDPDFIAGFREGMSMRWIARLFREAPND